MKTTSFVAFLSWVLCCTSSARAQTLEWIQQLGTSEWDSSKGVSVDGLGYIYISGFTEGSLEGTNTGDWDAFISKYDANGTFEWTRQLGTSRYDGSKGVSADGLGNVYISGYTHGSLEGTNAGGMDAFVSKYDASGTLEWTQQLGTSRYDGSDGVSADGLGNVYISGGTGGSLEGTNAGFSDAFVAKYSDVSEPGDFDGDGDVDGTDFLTWQRGESSNPLSQSDLALWQANFSAPVSGDFDGDNDVDGADFLAWQRGESPNSLNQSDLDDWQARFGNDASPMTATSTGVPEPATGLMLMLGMVATFIAPLDRFQAQPK